MFDIRLFGQLLLSGRLIVLQNALCPSGVSHNRPCRVLGFGKTASAKSGQIFGFDRQQC